MQRYYSLFYSGTAPASVQMSGGADEAWSISASPLLAVAGASVAPVVNTTDAFISGESIPLITV